MIGIANCCCFSLLSSCCCFSHNNLRACRWWRAQLRGLTAASCSDLKMAIGKYHCERRLITSVISILAIALCALSLWPQWQAPLKLQSSVVSVSQRPDISGVTGKLFKGAKERDYTGPRLLRELQPSANHNYSSESKVAKQWAVCTTIFKPSDAILGIIAFTEWSVVIVGDKGGAPFLTSAPNAVFLNVAAQQQMADSHAEFLKLLPWKHFGRKNLGFFYAITHGEL